MLVWYHDESEIVLPDVLQALTNGLRREPRLRFTLLEINDKPVRQSPLFTPLREVGFSSSLRGWTGDKIKKKGILFYKIPLRLMANAKLPDALSQ